MNTADSVKKDDVFDLETPSKKDEKVDIDKEKHIIMPPLDAYITERIKLQPKTLDEALSIEEVKHPERHRLSLPKEFEPYTKDFQFRWLLKDKRAIDESVYKGWVLVNRVLFPKVSPLLFSISGGVEEGDLILACMSKQLAEARMKAVREKSSDLVNAQVRKHEQNPDFYKPKLTSEEEKNDQAGDLQEGRDF
jgi:hypothetical protein